MPSRASTSSSSSHFVAPASSSLAASPMQSHPQQFGAVEDHDMANLSSADEDERAGAGYSNSKTGRAGNSSKASRGSAGSARRSASALAGDGDGDSASPSGNHHHHHHQDAGSAAAQNNNIGTTSGMTKEEAALADRRRRNRETQRAIRKKKANRLQDAEVRVTLFESEVEKLKVRLREVELENIGLRRELEEWKSGRIQAATVVPAASSQQRAAAGAGLPTTSTHLVSSSLPPNPLPLQQSVASLSHDQLLASERLSSTPISATSSASYSPYLASQQQHYQQQQPQQQGQGHRDNKNFVPYARQSYHASYDASAPNNLGKRKSFDQQQQLHTPSIAVRSPPYSHRGVQIPRGVQGAEAVDGNISTTSPQTSFAAAQPSNSETPSVFHQPVQQSPTSIEDASPKPQEARHTFDSSHLSALDTEEGSYGGSDPSPSSAGTVRPSYSSAYGGPAILSEALRAARFDDPRGRSTPSTSASMSEESSGGQRPSYDDYNDLWTSASNSQSQSDSLTSLSSYSRGASSSVLNAPHQLGHNNAAAAAAGQGQTVGADGMILSMSRQSLCASPLSMAAMSPGEEREDHAHHPAKRASVDPEVYQQRSQHHQNQRLPSLPSLTSSLGRAAQLLSSSNSKTIDRTVSMPASAPHAVSPTHYYAALHSATGAGNPRTLPPIHAALMGTGRDYSLPPPSREPSLPPLQPGPGPISSNVGKPPFSTRNGRGKSTSYPLAGHSTIYEGMVPADMLDRSESPSRHEQVSEDLHLDHHHAHQQLKWPGPVSSAAHAHAAQSSTVMSETSEPAALHDAVSPYNGAILPLPHRASTRPPVSSARGDIATSPPPASLLTRKNILNDRSPMASPVMSAEPESALMDDEMSELPAIGSGKVAEGNLDRFGRPRRKSTYEDFVELFGNHTAPEH